jgi:ankyrin repeat protein
MRQNLNQVFNKQNSPTDRELEAFGWAAAFGDNNAVNAFIDKYPAAINSAPEITFAPFTALERAISSQHKDTVELLLKRGASTETVHFNLTALGYAAANGKVEMIELLLEHGVKVNAIPADAGSALGAAIANQRPEAVKVLLAHGALLDLKDALGQTPLMYLQQLKQDYEGPAAHEKINAPALKRISEIESLIKQKINSRNNLFTPPKSNNAAAPLARKNTP